MSKLMKLLSNEEIENYTTEGKGLSQGQCIYYLSLCTGLAGNKPLDCGTCSYIFSQCGGGPSNPGTGGNCGTCTCH